MAIKLNFTKKQKILLWVCVPLALLIHRWVSISQEVDRLVSRLENGPQESRIEAAYALGQMGSTASGAVNSLAAAVRDPDAQIRSAATTALIQIDRGDAVESLIAAFDDRSSAVRLDAAEALERIGTSKARKALARSEQHSERRYQRARLSGWIEDYRRELKQEQKKKYRRHKKVYADY